MNDDMYYVSINETLPKQNSTKIHVLLFKVPIYRKKKKIVRILDS